jgi:hypothetical protein
MCRPAFAELPTLSGARGACLALQLLAAVLLWALMSTGDLRGGANWRRVLGLWGGSQAEVPRYVTPVTRHSSGLAQWAAAPGTISFIAPQSSCTLHPNSELFLARLCCWCGPTPPSSSKPLERGPNCC